LDSGPSPDSAEPEPRDTAEVNEEAITTVIKDDPECPVDDTPPKQESEGEKSGEAPVTVIETRVGPSTPPQVESKIHHTAMEKTPISELLLSIERGFLFIPSAPLSPPQSYL
ncbi:hypothetical protein B0H17DRAFT_864308, partial [Mycena rosella]